jgi:hypothetical protein
MRPGTLVRRLVRLVTPGMAACFLLGVYAGGHFWSRWMPWAALVAVVAGGVAGVVLEAGGRIANEPHFVWFLIAFGLAGAVVACADIPAWARPFEAFATAGTLAVAVAVMVESARFSGSAGRPFAAALSLLAALVLAASGVVLPVGPAAALALAGLEWVVLLTVDSWVARTAERRCPPPHACVHPMALTCAAVFAICAGAFQLVLA